MLEGISDSGSDRKGSERMRDPEGRELLWSNVVVLAQKIREIDREATIPDMLMFANAPDMAARELIAKADLMLRHEAITMKDGHGQFIELRALREQVVHALGVEEL